MTDSRDIFHLNVYREIQMFLCLPFYFARRGIGAKGTMMCEQRLAMMFAKQNDVDLRSNDVGFAQ